MVKKNLHTQLSRRESQIMDALFRLREAGVAEVLTALQHLDDPPGYNSARVLLGILEDKGLVVHRREGARYIYRPKISSERAGRSAAAHLVETFFRGSRPQAVAALLDETATGLSEEEYREIARLLERARKRRGKR